MWAVLAVPFVVAAAALHGRQWNPVLDMAMTELRVRDVGGGHTPLIGLPGRINVEESLLDQGSHPGPLSFYLLAPTYRVLGSSAWGLLVAMVLLALVAIGLALWLAERRGGAPLVLALGGLVVVVVRGYGMDVLTQPWNPYLPLLFWLVVLLATWSVLMGDRMMLVLAVAAGSLCAQTHMPYLALSLGMGALGVVAVIVHWVRHPSGRDADARALMTSAVVGVALWSPPVADVFGSGPWNLATLADYFRHPPEEPVGAAEGVRLALRHLDVFRLIGGAFGADGYVTRAGFRLDGSIVPGLVVLVVWVVAVILAWQQRHRLLLGLHAVIGWAFVLGAVSMGRIFGKVWYYLTLWAWTTTTLMVASIVWTAVVVIRQRVPHHARTVRLVGAGVGALVAVSSWTVLVVEAAGTRAPEQHLSDTLDAIAGRTAQALGDGMGEATSEGGRYLVTWNDAANFGSQGFGLLNELERRGFDVGVLETWRVPATRHRVIAVEDATAEVRLATGAYIEQVRLLPGAIEAVVYDPRDADDLAEYQQLEALVRAELEAVGLAELLPLLDTNLFGLQLNSAVSPEVQDQVDRMLHLGTTTAVFVLPPGSPL